jgi:copper homeostasis protein
MGGAQSIEISRDLAVGGLTPPLELVQAVRDAVAIPIHVIVRPHARDFTYAFTEVEDMLHYVERLIPVGVNGVVFGAIAVDGRLDIDLIQRVRRTAGSLVFTLHRALDTSLQPERSLEALIGCVPRVLTSGPAASAWAGRHGLRAWVQSYGQHFRFVCSGGIRLDQLAELAAYTGAPEFHIGSAARTAGAVDVEKVMQLRDCLAKTK